MFGPLYAILLDGGFLTKKLYSKLQRHATDLTQKGVDMRVGLDMARLALRGTVRAVIVVTGDSDFVPAFKFIRREGVKVILEPMGHNVRKELKAHSDIVL